MNYVEDSLSYNTQRPALHIQEYGRNVQNMIEYAKTIADREERNLAAQAIIDVMGQLNPHLRDIEDYKHKLWTHLFVMSNFELDVDSPYPIPEREKLNSKPEIMGYPNNTSKFGHFGSYAEAMIKEASQLEDGEEKDYLIGVLGNLMKKNYLLFHTGNVENGAIANYMKQLSNGKLILASPESLKPTRHILKEFGLLNNPVNQNQKRTKTNKTRKRKK